MFSIIQSQRPLQLLQHVIAAYRQPKASLFEPFIVIVPSLVLGDWLDKRISDEVGISTLITTTFWGNYQWSLMQQVLALDNQARQARGDTQSQLHVPEVAVLSQPVMRWQLFAFLSQYHGSMTYSPKHPLYGLLQILLGNDDGQARTSDRDDDTQINSRSHQPHTVDGHSDDGQIDQRLWQLAGDLARVFSRYVTHRPDWLELWAQDVALDMSAMIEQKDSLSQQFDGHGYLTPHWLEAHYEQMEVAQRYLWRRLFMGVYQHRLAVEQRFWQILTEQVGQCDNHQDNGNFNHNYKDNHNHNHSHNGNNHGNFEPCYPRILPRKLLLFTVQQLPQIELDFLQRLSQFVDITLLHYNPSQLFWADIVDKQWLQRQQIINPEAVYLRDHGHTLLSRLGKQSREMFAMLANMSGNELNEHIQIDWQDDFVDDFDQQQSPSNLTTRLLTRVQQDVLMLTETSTRGFVAAGISTSMLEQLENRKLAAQRHWSLPFEPIEPSPAHTDHNPVEPATVVSQYDDSLSIHSCHSLQRQLEVLRVLIGRWLNQPNAQGGQRHLSDIVVMLPDVARHEALIRSVFVNGQGQDGLTLPAKITGVVDKSTRQLWQAITGFYQLLGRESGRFAATEVMDWLRLPPLYTSLGLSFEQISRGCELLVAAGFVRGFDEAHLAADLDVADSDYRFSFCYALDQLVLGLLMPQAQLSSCLYPADNRWLPQSLPEKTTPYPLVNLADAPIITALCRLQMALAQHRHDYQRRQAATQWLDRIETDIIHGYFMAVDQTRSMRAIYDAINGFRRSLRANRHYLSHATPASQAVSDLNAADLHDDKHNDDHANQAVALEQMPLKLSFVLDSIAEQLASQQVSSEPSGVITFARFGSMRNLPYRLVVMLNMNLSEFPNRDRDSRYDLMQAGLARRGDRSSEDDDNGAFLDALLCATEACWIFYNGQSLTDTHAHLPANPVLELLQFLQGEVTWQSVHTPDTLPAAQYNTDAAQRRDAENFTDTSNSDSSQALVDQISRYMPKLVASWLVTQHPALPFADSKFIDSDFIDSHAAAPIEVNDINNEMNRATCIQATAQSTATEVSYWQQQLDTAMQQYKRAQQQALPPAPIWQAVFAQLRPDLLSKGSSPLAHLSQLTATSAQPAQSIRLLSSRQYQLMAEQLANIQAQVQKSSQLSDGNTALVSNLIHHSVNHVTGSATTTNIIQTIVIDRLHQQVSHPAKHFLQSQQIYVLSLPDPNEQQEPLSLSALAAYQLNALLIEQSNPDAQVQMQLSHHHIQPLLYQPLIPAGVARRHVLDEQQQTLVRHCRQLRQQLQILTQKSEVMPTDATDAAAEQALTVITDTHQVVLRAAGESWQGQVPVAADANYWCQLLPNTASPKHLLKVWLQHLFWQLHRQTTQAQVADGDGTSLCRFYKAASTASDALGSEFKDCQTFCFAPIDQWTALAELCKWHAFAQLTAQQPVVLMPKYALTYLSQQHKHASNHELGSAGYYPLRKHFTSWLSPAFASGFKSPIYDDCSLHDSWQYVLGSVGAVADADSDCQPDAFGALRTAMTALSPVLFEFMHTQLQAVAEG